MKVGKKIIIGSFVFLFLICGILVLSRQHHKSSALFLYYILTFDSSQQLQQMRRPSVSVERERQVTLSWFWYIHEKKWEKRKEKMMFQMSCNSKIVVKHIRHGITKTLPSASAVSTNTSIFSLPLHEYFFVGWEKVITTIPFLMKFRETKKHIETISVNKRENNM